MATLRAPARTLLTLGATLLTLTACDRISVQNDTSADFARAALERNDHLTVVAFDKKENTFTVRLKDTGELRVVRVDEIVGSIPGEPEAASKPQPVSDQAPANGEVTAGGNSPSAQSVAPGEVARPVD